MIPAMTPRERAAVALQGGTPDFVPTMEIDFELQDQLLGKQLILGKDLGAMSPAERRKALNHNVDVYLETALALDYSSITVHPTPTPGYTPGNRYYPTLEDECYVIRTLKTQAAERFFVAAGIDATYAIPDSEQFYTFAYRMFDEPESLLEYADGYTDWAIDQMKRLIESGAEIMYLCSDYCFNQGPFLSPEQFERFIYPYLRREVQELRRAGAYVIKHTDGNILPILEMMLDCQPHAIHSIDPIAGLDIRQVKAMIAGRAAIMGNVNSALIQTGDQEGVRQSAEYALRWGMPGGGYIFSTCNSVFTGMHLADYQVMLDARKRMGCYCEVHGRDFAPVQ